MTSSTQQVNDHPNSGGVGSEQSPCRRQDLVGFRELTLRMSHAILFDGDQVKRLAELSDRPRRRRGSMLVWVDVAREAEDARVVAETFGIDDQTRELLIRSGKRAHFQDHGGYIHLSTFAPSEDADGELIALECVVAKHWVVTAHDEPIRVLDEFAERASGSGNTGWLDDHDVFRAPPATDVSAPEARTSGARRLTRSAPGRDHERRRFPRRLDRGHIERDRRKPTLCFAVPRVSTPCSHLGRATTCVEPSSEIAFGEPESRVRDAWRCTMWLLISSVVTTGLRARFVICSRPSLLVIQCLPVVQCRSSRS